MWNGSKRAGRICRLLATSPAATSVNITLSIDLRRCDLLVVVFFKLINPNRFSLTIFPYTEKIRGNYTILT